MDKSDQHFLAKQPSTSTSLRSGLQEMEEERGDGDALYIKAIRKLHSLETVSYS